MFWSLHRSSLSLGRFLRGSGAVWKANMRRVWVAIILVSCSLFLSVTQLWSRLMLPPSMADVRELAEKAPLVFRGHVLEVIPLTFNAQTGAGNRYIAKIQVDRWYRGGDQRKKRCDLRMAVSRAMGTIALIFVLNRIGSSLHTKRVDNSS